MSDLIDRQAAIDALVRIFDRCEEIEAHLPEGDPDKSGYKMYPDYITVWEYLHQLPSAQPEVRTEMSSAEDLISRQAAIDVIERKKDKSAKGDIGGFYNKIIQNDIDALMQLPSAQPDVPDTNVGDMISRQAAIYAVKCGALSAAMVYGRTDAGRTALIETVKAIKALPSAQPEITRCKDCLHWVRTCGDNQWGLGDCDVFDKHLVMCEGFCAWAERREE